VSANREQLHRHAVHAFEDLCEFLRTGRRSRLHSAEHHMRHCVWRSGREVPQHKRVHVEQGARR
jgi:hypothetical protein